MRKIILLLIMSMSMGLSLVTAQTYSTNFDSDTPGSAPAGWTSYTTQSDDPGFKVIRDTGMAKSPYQFMGHLGDDISQTSDSWIVSPAISLNNNQELVFYWRIKWSFAYNYSGVYISTGSNDPLANPGDFTELAEFDPDDYPTWNEWNKAMFDLRSYAGQTVYIAFKYTGDFSHDFYVDDFSVGTIPYCNPTTDIYFNATTDNSVSISWEPVPEVEDYEVVWGPPGFDPDTATPYHVNGYSLTIQGLDPHTWYDVYVRTICSPYNYSSWSGPKRVRTSPEPNDNCDGAIEIPVTQDCSSPVIANNTVAFDSGVPDPGCAGYDGGDLWYKTTVPASGNIIVETLSVDGSDVSDTGMAVYSGDCDNLSLIECNDDGGDGYFSRIRLTGLTAGDVIYIRVWEYGNDKQGDFGVCVTEASPPPANDDCSGAISLTVYPEGGGAGNEISASTVDATASQYAHTSCDDVGTNLDLFYTFVAPASGTVAIITGGDTGDDIEAAVYDSCGGNELACFGTGTYKLVSGLTGGQTYVLQIWHDDFNAGDFTIVLEEGPTGPPNDDCSAAIDIPVTSDCSSPVIANNIGATDSGIGDPSCGASGYEGGDVWFKTTVPADGNVTIETTAVSGSDVTDTTMEVFEGDCSNLISVGCNDDIAYPNAFSRVELTGLTPGATLYIRVWEYGNNRYGEFGICAYNSSLSISDVEAYGFSFYPNPASNRISFKADQSVERIQIMSISGQILIEETENGLNGNIDISSLSKGVYLLKVRIDGKEGTYRLLKH